jgi:hypothetical protein
VQVSSKTSKAPVEGDDDSIVVRDGRYAGVTCWGSTTVMSG